MVGYDELLYPSGIPVDLQLVYGYFDTEQIVCDKGYILKTECCFDKSSFASSAVSVYKHILDAHKLNVPQLWKNVEWAEEFAEFLIDSTKHLQPPTVIEISPPFDDYILDLEEFVEIYKIFEKKIKGVYPNTEIHIANRCVTVYGCGKYLLSTVYDIIELCQILEQNDLQLKIALDIFTLYSAHNITQKKRKNIMKILSELEKYRQCIGSVHIWGKGTVGERRVPRCGDLDSYFLNDVQLKEDFLISLASLFSDDTVRYLILDVDSGEDDLLAIIGDLYHGGCSFT